MTADTTIAAGPGVTDRVEAAPHHTEARRQHLCQLADSLPRWAQGAREWLEGDPTCAGAFRRLLLVLDRYQDVLNHRKVCKAGGHYGTVIHGLAALAHHHGAWRREPEAFAAIVQSNGQPQSVDQFGDLARHLLVRYEVPSFLDEAWFMPRGEEARRRQAWFIGLGNGASVRDLDLPIHFTKRMAHSFMQRRNRDSVEHNLRFCQVLGLGGDLQMARTVQKTRLGRHLEHDDFWCTVVLFLASNPMIDPAQVGPVIDYVHNQRFAPQRVVRDGGGVEEVPPPQPHFTMKGRSVTKLLRQVEEWHGHLARDENVVFQSWQPCGVRPWTLEEAADGLGAVRWTMQELLSSWELAAEGTAMGHCVVSYADQCADGHTAIFSLGLQRDGERREGVLTVAVDPARRQVTQARGRYNMLPNQTPRSAQARQAAQAGYLDKLNRSEAVLQRWLERERLSRRD